MNDFIEITNRVIEEKMKDKIYLSHVEYSTIDQMFIIKVYYFTLNFVKLTFRYTTSVAHVAEQGKDILELEFKAFIDDKVLLLKKGGLK